MMTHILPPALIRSLKKEYHFEEEPFFKVHESGEQVTSIRLNPYKNADNYSEEENIPWCKEGKYLKQRPSFISDPEFHAGIYYAQEASSMFLHRVLEQEANLNTPLKVLDLCASPGGKSTLISSLINQESLLLSNEIIKTRIPALVDNLTKWGPSNIFVSNNDPKDFNRLAGFFDIMVVDAPCSGSGMFRKDPEAINEWSEGAVELCSQRQQRILADSYQALQKDGLLVYSTCSYSREENEDISDWLCDNFDLTPVKIKTEKQWGIIETTSSKHGAFGYRFYPDKVKGEGFFICCFRKNDGSTSDFRVKQKLEYPSKQESEVLSKWVKGDIMLVKAQNEFYAIPASGEDSFKILQSKLYLKKSGTRIGRMAGKELIPDHELALSLIVHPDIPKLNLSKQQALIYLKKEELKIETDQKGWALMCYHNYPLGWAKILPNRINNYYPKELRILKDIKDL